MRAFLSRGAENRRLVQAVISGDTPSVYIVNKDGVAEQKAISIGLETPEKVQITKGLEEGDLVVVGNRKGIRPGQKVTPKLVEPVKAS